MDDGRTRCHSQRDAGGDLWRPARCALPAQRARRALHPPSVHSVRCACQRARRALRPPSLHTACCTAGRRRRGCSCGLQAHTGCVILSLLAPHNQPPVNPCPHSPNAGFQLWINLPAKDKMMKPRYQDYQADDIPVAEKDGASGRASCPSAC